MSGRATTSTRVIFLVIIAIVLTVQVSAAQLVTSKGIKAGLSLARLDYESNFADGIGEDWKTGFVGGIFLGLGVARGLEIVPQVLYAQRGGQESAIVVNESGEEIGEVEFKWMFDYLEVPVLVRYRLPVGGSFHPTVMAGPAVAFKLSSKSKLEDPDHIVRLADPDQDPVQEVEGIASTDFFLMAGVGFDIDLGSTTLIIEGIYGHGMTNLLDSEVATWKNRTISILVGISF